MTVVKVDVAVLEVAFLNQGSNALRTVNHIGMLSNDVQSMSLTCWSTVNDILLSLS